ncbi:MAG TPA: DUF1552 domain-containing protein [Bdellovibrionales bacterium]|nr:DUF1552 domain-containing protein [Bdellovibrionales bacterium]
MYYNRQTRRAFLKGTGVLFALPFVPAFLNTAHAQAPARVKRLVSLFLGSGASEPMWFPQLTPAELTTVGPGYRARRMTEIWALKGQISPIFSDPKLATLAKHLNIYRGLDSTGFVEHCKAVGLSAVNCGDRGVPTYPSVDHLVARSPLTYATEPHKRFSLLGVTDQANHHSGVSSSFSETSSGLIVPVPSILSPIAAWDYFFKGLVTGGDEQKLELLRKKRKSLLDSVVGEYNALMASGKLAASERESLESHVDQFRELEKKVTAISAPPSCGSVPEKPVAGLFKTTPDKVVLGQFEKQIDIPLVIDLMLDITATALRCQLTNVVTVMLDAASWGLSHLDIPEAHALSHYRTHGEASVRTMAHNKTRAMQAMIISKVLGFAQKLDIPDPLTPAENMLDNTLILGTNEMGAVGNHRPWSLPAFTIGGGARLNAGWYVDYRTSNLIDPAFSDEAVTGAPAYHGRDYNSFLIGAMRAMGLQPADWERGAKQGFGSYEFTKPGWYVESESSPKGIITAGKRSAPPFMLKS